MADTVYLEYSFTVEPLVPGSEILIAQLGEAGFESFVEQGSGVLAYIQKKDWRPGILDGIAILHSDQFTIAHTLAEIPQQNWNAAWEENFNPIQIDHRCTVRAPFHEKPDTLFDIVIEPKMSFGTGHHETTHMMLSHILDLDLQGKSVLDMGCGTGVLAILAAMKGAAPVTAIDIDHWCYLNAKENITRNNYPAIKVLEGGAELLGTERYDLILANINRNILLRDIPAYVGALNPNGVLLLSGFYREDLDLISEKCLESGARLEKKFEKNNWVSVKYVL